MSLCHLCAYECSDEDGYCIQCGASLSDSDNSTKSPEWASTEELLDLSKTLSSTFDLQLLLRKIDDSAVKLTEAAAGAIMLFDDKKESLRFGSSSGEKANIIKLLPVKDGIAWWVGQSGKSVRVEIASDDDRFTGNIDKITGFETRNLLCVPLVLEDETIGVIEVLNKLGEKSFTERDEQLLSVLTGQAAVAVKNVRLATEQRNFFNHVIEILVMAIESTRLVPLEHCWRVAKLATAIGRELKMQDQDLQDLYYAAALHDLGMLKMRKSGIVDKSQLRSHPTLGANMMRDIGILSGTENIIRHHHEYIDGSGYPDGLTDKEIPIGSKIISVIETYEEAIAQNGSPILAEAHIQEYSGKLFDVEIVDAFLDLIVL